jgi:CubicO group peptidase (beta-lactamase class C family)
MKSMATTTRMNAAARLALLAFPAAACLAQNPARMDQVVQAYVANHTFMGTVLVARGSQVLFSKGYGSANLEWDVPNAPNTKFRLGSVTKQFTAACILLLEERGKLNVNDPVSKYLPDSPKAWEKITIFHVLTHTSGIPNFTSFPDYAKLEPFAATPEQLVARFRDKPLDFAPGTQWSYSNSGFVLLGYLVERISGVKYDAFVRDNIFTPLGMKDSGYDSNSGVIAHRAAGYVSTGGRFENAGFIHMSTPHGAGALYSTTEDLLKWEQGLFGGKVLQPASLAKMTTPFKNHYAFGIGVDSVNGRKLISHGGGIEGFNTELDYYPADQLTVVVLGNVNGGAPGTIAGQLGKLAHGETVTLASERKEITLDAKTLARYVGAYRMANDGPTLVVTLDGNQLFTRLGAQAAIPIYPESPTMFFLKVVDAQNEFLKNDAQGRPTQLILHQGGRDQTAIRLDDAESGRIVAAAEALAKRIKDQTPAAGTEAALRRLIEELRAGTPDYGRMSPSLADAMRPQVAQQQASLAQLGALQSLAFKGVGPGGADIYTAKFANGTMEYRIWLAPDGKIESTNVRPVTAP